MSHWDGYFARHLDNFVSDGGLREQLLEADEDVFHSKSNIIVHDVAKDTGAVSRSTATSEGEMNEIFKTRHSKGTRFISIHSERTIAPLKATSRMMALIFQEYHVKMEFLPVVLSFGNEPHESEASSSHFGHFDSETEEYVIFYKFNFVELNHRGGPNPWSIRHVGIYHHHTADTDLFILLHCTRSTAFYKTFMSIMDVKKDAADEKAALRENPMAKQLAHHPERLHSLLISSYAGNWGPYFRHLGEIFSKTNNTAMVDDVDKTIQASFPVVQDLRNTNDMALFANACCSNNVDVLDRLSKCPSLSSDSRNSSARRAQTARSYIGNSKNLQDRIGNVIDLVGYTLTVHNQMETGKLDKEVRDMTKKLHDLTQTSVDDSAIVRLITIVSAFYLPGSFVGSLFGMNFFVFDTDYRRIDISHDFWIFILTWFIFTAMTFGFFYLVYWSSKNKKLKAFQGQA